MGCVTRIFSVLISIVIVFMGFLTASSGFLGSSRPEFGIPIIIIGAGLFIFIVVVGIFGTKWPTPIETLVITMGVILLAIGVERINVAVNMRTTWAWPIIMCPAGVFVVLCHRRIAGWVRSAARFLKRRP